MKIICKNTNITKEYDFGTSLHEIIEDQKITNSHPFLGALVDNEAKELSYRIFKPHTVEFINITHREGMRMNFRSLYFVLMKAVKSIYPDIDVMIEHSVSKGYFCQLVGKDMTGQAEQVNEIKNKMTEIIDANIPFVRNEILNSEAIEIFEKNNYPEKARLFKQSPSLYTCVYSLEDMIDYFYGFLVPSTGYLKVFDLIQLYDGMLLKVPDRKKPDKLEPFVKQDMMFDILEEHKSWVEILNTANVGRLNEQIIEGNDSELIKISEALHEKKIAEIADEIKNKGNIKLILVAGPSSSGKTTFSKRLAVQLKVSGLKPIQISLDNYFVNRDQTPLDENGDYDFESLDALDTKTFNKNINDLKAGKTIDLPKFSFETGERYFDGTTLSADEDTIFIAEGIHALNPKLTENIDDDVKYKIYISALTQIGIDGHNRIPTTDNRLIRRIIRDHKYRGYSVYDTLSRWESVRRGEEKNIFPFQEEADIMFNSALLYELAVLKKYAEPLLKDINQSKPEHAEAKRLLKFFSYFKDINIEDEIPPTSILREFLGKSTFHY
ncbi:MAG: nucleoside kinase [Bacteroidales bacterium]|nr:nucleoside kinase [Bacteroidales bacterium]